MAKPRAGGGELFYLDEHGNKQDAALHEEILRDGDHAAAKAVSDKIKARILREAGRDPDQPLPELVTPPAKKDE